MHVLFYHIALYSLLCTLDCSSILPHLSISLSSLYGCFTCLNIIGYLVDMCNRLALISTQQCPSISTLSTFYLPPTVYWEIFVSLNFCKFREFCLVVKLNFVKVSPCHTHYIAHMDHSRNYLFATI